MNTLEQQLEDAKKDVQQERSMKNFYFDQVQNLQKELDDAKAVIKAINILTGK